MSTETKRLIRDGEKWGWGGWGGGESEWLVHAIRPSKAASARDTATAKVELCESRGGRPGLPVLMSLMVSVDVKLH